MSLRRFIDEDLAAGDVTSESVLGDEPASGRVFVKEDCVVAGIAEALEVFRTVGARADATASDGDRCAAGETVLAVSGSAKAILAGERLALNLLGRMSGIATETARVLEIARSANPRIRIAATRKTTPGFREYEKRAVELGGGERHRFNLGDAVLIKDNHVKLVGSVREAVRRAKGAELDRVIEVEVESLEDALVGAGEGADVIMLDNMTPEQCAEAYRGVKEAYPSVTVEVSGGIRPDNIAEYSPHADVISLGYLTHSTRSIDVSLELD